MSKKICYSVFLEDKPYLLWQLELFLYSITKRGGVESKDVFVFWSSPDFYGTDDPSGNEPWQPSEWLRDIFAQYGDMPHRYCQNFGRQNRAFRFLGKGHWHGKPYPGLNKWSSWIEWANAGVFDEWDEVMILEQDLWFSGPIPKMPDGNCVSFNWIPDRKEAFKKSVEPEKAEKIDPFGTCRGFKKTNFKGQDLDKVMELCGATPAKRNKWKQGAVLFKFRTKDLKPKLLNDIMNYNYMLIHLMEIKHPEGMRHETDMIAPGLALAHNGIEMKVLSEPQWLTETWTHDEEIPENTIVHYGWDFNNYEHLTVDFGKSQFNELAPWQQSRELLRENIEKAKYEWTKNFFRDMLNIHMECPNVLRRCVKVNKELRV